MIDIKELPDTDIDKAEMLKAILVARATTTDPQNNDTYVFLRRYFMERNITKNLLPKFIIRNSDLGSFWSFIQPEAKTYAERKTIIRDGLFPLIEYLENGSNSFSDDINSEILQNFDSEGVASAWQKAIIRRTSDPEGAITSARTLLETVCKHILDATNTEYNDKDDLPKLYNLTAQQLNLAPSQHTEDAIKSILGGVMNLVNGLGTLRNRISDAHGQGKNPVKPSIRHANLAVNCAGTIATFLVETYNQKTS
jgi:hypothetical protein